MVTNDNYVLNRQTLMFFQARTFLMFQTSFKKHFWIQVFWAQSLRRLQLRWYGVLLLHRLPSFSCRIPWSIRFFACAWSSKLQAYAREDPEKDCWISSSWRLYWKDWRWWKNNERPGASTNDRVEIFCGRTRTGRRKSRKLLTLASLFRRATSESHNRLETINNVHCSLRMFYTDNCIFIR